MTGHRGWVEGVQFIPNTAFALSGGRAGRLIKWSVDLGRMVTRVETLGRLYEVAVSPGSVSKSKG